MSANFTPNSGIISGGLKSQIKSPRGYMAQLVLLIIIGVLFWWFIVSPKQTVVSDVSSQLKVLQSQESKIADASALLQQRITDLDNNQQQIAKLDQALPLDDSTLRLNLLVNNLVQSSGVTIGSLNISGQSADTIVSGNKALLSNPFGPTRTVKAYSVAMSVNGSFDQVMALLNKLENSGRIMDITSLSVSGSSPGVLTLQLNLSVYYLST